MAGRHLHRVCLLLALALTRVVEAASAAAVFVVTEPWMRVAPDGGSAEVYMQLRSSDGAALVAARSESAANVAMRAPGSARRDVDRIAIPAGSTVSLAPGQYRLVLGKLDRRPRLGERVDFVLTIEAVDGSRQDIPVRVEVRRRSPTDDHLHPHAH